MEVRMPEVIDRPRTEDEWRSGLDGYGFMMLGDAANLLGRVTNLLSGADVVPDDRQSVTDSLMALYRDIVLCVPPDIDLGEWWRGFYLDEDCITRGAIDVDVVKDVCMGAMNIHFELNEGLRSRAIRDSDRCLEDICQLLMGICTESDIRESYERVCHREDER